MIEVPTDESSPELRRADTTLPHRKIIRRWLKPISQRNTLLAVFLLSADWALFAILTAGTVLFAAWWAKLVCAVAAGIMIGRLFIIGHDACHQSYTAHRTLNRFLGRIAMVPSLTPYSLWQVGHNVVHHGYTNLKGVDFVWAPLTQAEYDALPAWRKGLERVYRSGWGSALYYFNEMWWLRMFFPSKAHMGTRRKEFHIDGAFVAITAGVWIASLIALANATYQSGWILVLFGFVVPFVVWNALIGFVVYVHHTHAAVPWYNDKRAWAKSAPFISTTVHLIFPYRIGGLFHNIMEHTAHHVDMGVPLYRLQGAQQILEDSFPERITVQRFSWRWYLDTARRCKLYDFERNCWTDFKGNKTSFA